MVKGAFPKGRAALPKRMNFWKSSKRPLIPPPHFRKIMLRFFSGIHDLRSVYNGKNLQHKFLDWNFSKNSSVLVGLSFPNQAPINAKMQIYIRRRHSPQYSSNITICACHVLPDQLLTPYFACMPTCRFNESCFPQDKRGVYRKSPDVTAYPEICDTRLTIH